LRSPTGTRLGREQDRQEPGGDQEGQGLVVNLIKNKMDQDLVNAKVGNDLLEIKVGKDLMDAKVDNDLAEIKISKGW
jgi:hypothetical protein